MASDPITLWQIDEENMETVTDSIFLGSEITADVDFSHKRHLLLGRKAMTNLHSILKSRDITLLTKVHIAKAMFFPVVMYRCESWTLKQAEIQKAKVFKLWWWRRLLRVPWIARRRNQSILNEINPWYSLEDWCWSTKSLATWCKETTHWKNLDAGKIKGRRRREQQRIWELDRITDSTDMSMSKLWETAKDRKGWHDAVHGIRKSWTWLSDWITVKKTGNLLYLCVNILHFLTTWCHQVSLTSYMVTGFYEKKNNVPPLWNVESGIGMSSFLPPYTTRTTRFTGKENRLHLLL